MNSLLRADLSRVFKHRSTVYVLFGVMLLVALLYAVLIPLAQEFLKNSGEAEYADITRLGWPTPLAFSATALLTFGIVGFLSCWAVTSVAWADIRSGYDRTIISSCGKRIYYREKFTFASVVSLIFVAGTVVIGSVASGIISGYEEIGSIVNTIIWCLYVAIISWACACLSLVVLWVTKNSTISYITGFVLCTGLLSSVIGMFLANISPEVVQVWTDISDWFPKGAFSHLETITDGSFDLSNDNFLHLIITPVVCLSISYHVALRHLTRI